MMSPALRDYPDEWPPQAPLSWGLGSQLPGVLSGQWDLALPQGPRLTHHACPEQKQNIDMLFKECCLSMTCMSAFLYNTHSVIIHTP